jgi:hypothetical protein
MVIARLTRVMTMAVVAEEASWPGDNGGEEMEAKEEGDDDGSDARATPTPMSISAPSVGRGSRAPATSASTTVTAAWLLASGATSETGPRASAQYRSRFPSTRRSPSSAPRP